ncbi:uncharacterized protein LOC112126498 isoform X2 [Cimex lectularius]|uniref:Uncharacterized protein n=1 Tax=Cimex lectularius TaxID=79782 RepID=A0A8I6TLX2_CIMLE|nr:uncharacterized protein LOC112126498 isoform X2 [Cimex lectularius]
MKRSPSSAGEDQQNSEVQPKESDVRCCQLSTFSHLYPSKRKFGKTPSVQPGRKEQFSRFTCHTISTSELQIRMEPKNNSEPAPPFLFGFVLYKE